MSKIWAIIIVLSIVTAIVIGNPDIVVEQITKAGVSATENIITYAGMICFWTGIFNILKNTKLINLLSGFFKPVINKLFEKEKLNEEIKNDMSLNIASNVIGVGNAATAFGVKAMENMNEINEKKDKANNNMTTFVLLNSASLQIIPTSIISLRMIYGSKSATSIIIPVWIVTVIALIFGIVSIKILNKVVK